MNKIVNKENAIKNRIEFKKFRVKITCVFKKSHLKKSFLAVRGKRAHSTLRSWRNLIALISAQELNLVSALKTSSQPLERKEKKVGTKNVRL